MAINESNNLHEYCLDVAQRAKRAAAELAVVTGAQKQQWLRRCARLLGERSVALAEANRLDIAAAPELRAVRRRSRPPAADARSASPRWPRPWKKWPRCPSRSARSSPRSIRPNGLEVQKVRVPLGVIFFIYESRPNVTADAAALCVKAGNAVILRGGKEAVHSNAAIAEILAEAAADAGLPADAVQLVATTDRAAVGHLLRMPEYINLCIPRGGESLIRRVSEEARCRSSSTSPATATCISTGRPTPTWPRGIVVNAKCQRMGVCNAAESLVVHADAAGSAAAADRQGACWSAASRSAATKRTRKLLPAGQAGHRRRLSPRSTSGRSSRARWSIRSTRRSSTSTATVRSTPRRS